MRPWSIPLARWRGRQDAEAGVFLGREFVDERLGPRPAWDPVGRHALLTIYNNPIAARFDPLEWISCDEGVTTEGPMGYCAVEKEQTRIARQALRYPP